MSTGPTRIPRLPGAAPQRRTARRGRRAVLLGLVAVLLLAAAAGAWFVLLRDTDGAAGGATSGTEGTPALVRYQPDTGVVERLDDEGVVVWTTTVEGGPYHLLGNGGRAFLMVADDGDLSVLDPAGRSTTEVDVADGLSPFRIQEVAVLTDPTDPERAAVVDLATGSLVDLATLGLPANSSIWGVSEFAEGAVVIHADTGTAQFTLSAPGTIWWTAGQLIDAAGTVSLVADEREEGAPTVLRRFVSGVQTGKAVIVTDFMHARLMPQGALVVDAKGAFLTVDFESGSAVPISWLATQLVGFDTVRFVSDDRLLAGAAGRWSVYTLDGTVIGTVDAARIVPDAMGGQMGWARSRCALMNVPDTQGRHYSLVIEITTGQLLSVVKGQATAAPTADGCTFIAADGRDLQLVVDGLAVDLVGTPVALSPDHTLAIVEQRRGGKAVQTLVRLTGSKATVVRELEGDGYRYGFVMV
ncbi:MAG: hypothetical protein Q7V88_15695 [Actinomycetota bacterium]|nr:hypothetical protein [Actinomycetota bacterium]